MKSFRGRRRNILAGGSQTKKPQDEFLSIPREVFLHMFTRQIERGSRQEEGWSGKE